MTLPKNKKIEHEHIESMKIAVDQAGIQAIHPDKLEEFCRISGSTGKRTTRVKFLILIHTFVWFVRETISNL